MSLWIANKFGENAHNNVPFLYSAYHIQMASLCARCIITPALAFMQHFSAKSIRRNKFLLGTHLLHLGDNCGQNALSKGVRTEWDSNQRPSDCKSRAGTTTHQYSPKCSHSPAANDLGQKKIHAALQQQQQQKKIIEDLWLAYRM